MVRNDIYGFLHTSLQPKNLFTGDSFVWVDPIWVSCVTGGLCDILSLRVDVTVN